MLFLLVWRQQMSTFYIMIEADNYIYVDSEEDNKHLPFNKINDNIYVSNRGRDKTYKITLDLEDSNDDLCFMIFNCDCNQSVEINTPLHFYKTMSECSEWLNDGVAKYHLKKTITCYYEKCATYEMIIYSLVNVSDYFGNKLENGNERRITDNSFTLIRFYQ